MAEVSVPKPLVDEFVKKSIKWNMVSRAPFVGRKKKLEVLNKFLDSLSEDCFKSMGVAFMVMNLDISQETCEKYNGVEAQVKGFLDELPRYKQFEVDVREHVSHKRELYCLPL